MSIDNLLHGLLLLVPFHLEWASELIEEIGVSIKKRINLCSLDWVPWVVTVHLSEHSEDCGCLSKFSSIWHLKAWNYSSWHSWLECWPLIRSKSYVFVLNIGVCQQSSGAVSSPVENKVVKGIFVWHICALFFNQL